MILSDRGVNGRQSPARPQRGPSEDGKAIAVPFAPSDSTALGIYAKTAAAFPEKHERPRVIWATVDSESGEVAPLHQVGTELRLYVSPQAARAQRFALKSVVNKLIPKGRTAKCMRWLVPKQELQIHRSREHGKAFYSGLQVCASVWHCPVCAAKISERRRVELQSAITTAKAMGWQVMLLTLTVPHGLGDDIDVMLDQMMAAWRATSSNRAGKALRSSIGLQGTIRALEVTDGSNGFHPHFHALLFLDSNMTPKAVEAGFRPLWQSACLKAGLPRPSDRHGVKVDDGSKAAAYASKWGLESELTKGHMKHGKEGGMTPWDMLRDVLENDSERSRKRFMVYAEAFKGRRQLYWSNGLKARLAVVDLADDEIVAQVEDEAVVLAKLTSEQWKAVLATRSESALLDVAENNPDALDGFLEGLQAMVGRMADGTAPAVARLRRVIAGMVSTATEQEKPVNQNEGSE